MQSQRVKLILSQAERDEFEKFDLENEIRTKFRKALIEQFSDFGLTFSIGGQISIDVYPTGTRNFWSNFRFVPFLTPKVCHSHIQLPCIVTL